MKNLIACLVVCVLSGASFADTWTVDNDGKADFNNIQAAIDAASDGDEIIVAPGTYTASGVSHVVDMKGKEITLRAAGSPEETIIDGEGTRRGVVFHSGETPNTKLIGFTIYRCRNAYHDYDENGSASWWEQQLGGGLLIYSCSPRIENCTMLLNSAAWDGGGAFLLYQYEAPTSPVFVNCKFIANSAQYGGGIMGGGILMTPTLINCEFINNSSSGTFYPTGGGILSMEFASWNLVNCSFEGNTAGNGGGGIGLSHGSTAELVNCTVTDNSAAYGGGLYAASPSSFSLLNSMVCSNYPDQINGEWSNNGGNEINDFCPGGACCVTSGCAVVEENICMDLGGTWLGGKGDTCDDCPQSCNGDLNSDGVVGVDDLLLLIGAWGTCP